MEVNNSVGKTEVLLQLNGTGVANVRDALNTGTQKMNTEHLVFGCLNIGITQHYKHLGSVNAGPHKYDQEHESRVGQAQSTNNALRRKLFGNKGIPTRHILTVWKDLTFSKLIFHSAIWGTFTMGNWKRTEATNKRGLRIIHGEAKYVAQTYGNENKFRSQGRLKSPTNTAS